MLYVGMSGKGWAVPQGQSSKVSSKTVPKTPPPLDAASILKGLIFTLAIVVISAVVLSLVVYTTNMTERSLPLIFKLISTFSIAFGGAVAARKAHARGWLHGGLVGIAFVVLCFFFSYAFHAQGITLASIGKEFVLALISGIVGGVIGVNF
ncbi:MAG TPA: TIGR04086 family membrane protein [Clostridia bacterium]|nr:TIGR04086 family membrane protein [Clostridia bacterium]